MGRCNALVTGLLGTWAATAWPAPPDRVNPHFDLVNLRALDWEPQSVTGLAWLGPDTLVVAEFGGVSGGEREATRKGKLHLLKGVLAAKGPEGVTRETLLEGLAQPMGVSVRDGAIYLHEKGAQGTEIAKVTRGAGGRWTRELFAKGWGEGEGYMWHAWPGGLVFHQGAFHFNFSSNLSNGYRNVTFGGTRWPPTDRGSWIRLDPGNKQWKVMATGMRTNAAIWVGPWQQLFGPDVQGDWMPDNKVIHLQEGRHYGHNYGAVALKPESPPMAYCPQGDACFSPGEGVYMKKGPFKGQMLVAEHKYGGINRYFIERINGEMQAAVFDFGSTPTAQPFRGAHAQRILATPDETSFIYGCAGGWWVAGPTLGSIARLTPNGRTGFEMLAIRNLGPAAFEIEFTQPADPATLGLAASYAVQTWTRQPQEAYGAGTNIDKRTLTVTSVLPGSGNRKVRLEFAPGALSTGTVKKEGGKLVGVGYTVSFELKGLKSAAGEVPFDAKAFYTLNQFGPGESPLPGCMTPGDAEYDAAANDPWPSLCASAPVAVRSLPHAGPGMRARSGRVSLTLTGPGWHAVRFFGVDGQVALSRRVAAGEHVFEGFPRPGLYCVLIEGAGGGIRRRVLVE